MSSNALLKHLASGVASFGSHTEINLSQAGKDLGNRLLGNGELCGIIQKTINEMEIITIENTAHRELMEKIDRIHDYIRQSETARAEKKPEKLLTSEQVMDLLQISKRTLQRLRSEKEIGYSLVRGRCRYPLSEVERLMEDNRIIDDPQGLDEFKHNHQIKTQKRWKR
ncbi:MULTISPECIES: helix-turn-helix domain-containing protein [Bacteroides]|uniref:helix-turn-helix domain-containing protein n=1 Tax=Bacteroides TaxID=816 RepID=UPI0026E04746|nr:MULTISPECIES: helix-turn-helix domain-containing protein [Bacteroides]MCS2261991.1 helix-turn-helix domain-containing protein [Bacteroides thetaiotaomicron]MDO5421031.1 helix-turn-helix domain-containing protein [Bacteroides sp.]